MKRPKNTAQMQAESSVVAQGANGTQARYIATEGELRFTIAVDPGETNYITLKMWGGDAAGQEIETESGPDQTGFAACRPLHRW